MTIFVRELFESIPCGCGGKMVLTVEESFNTPEKCAREDMYVCKSCGREIPASEIHQINPSIEKILEKETLIAPKFIYGTCTKCQLEGKQDCPHKELSSYIRGCRTAFIARVEVNQ